MNAHTHVLAHVCTLTSPHTYMATHTWPHTHGHTHTKTHMSPQILTHIFGRGKLVSCPLPSSDSSTPLLPPWPPQDHSSPSPLPSNDSATGTSVEGTASSMATLSVEGTASSMPTLQSIVLKQVVKSLSTTKRTTICGQDRIHSLACPAPIAGPSH